MCQYTLSKPIECTIPRVNPNVNYKLWLIKNKTKGVKIYGEDRQKNIGTCLFLPGTQQVLEMGE